MQTGDYVRVTIDTYDGPESMYGRIENVTHAMGIYFEPIYEVATENGKSLFDIKELEYLRGPFKMDESILIGSVTHELNSVYDPSALRYWNRSNYNMDSCSDFEMLTHIYGIAKKRASSYVYASHTCTPDMMRIWPMDYNKRFCKECGEWEAK